MNGVKARRFVWSDTAIQSLAKQFVAVADEVHSLRTGTDDEARLFQGVLAQVEHQHAGHQGVFVITPGGKCLASAVGYDNPKNVRKALGEGLARWNQMTRAERSGGLLLDAFTTSRSSKKYPEDGLVLRVTSRDVGQVPGQNRSDRWSRSFVWFKQPEAISLVPNDRVPGSTTAWPKALALWLARFALLDKGQVDGFTHPFSAAEVRKADLISTVIAVSGNSIELSFTGQTVTEAADAAPFFDRGKVFAKPYERRGVSTLVQGNATFDLAQGRFTKFEMLAIGMRRGGAYVGRPDDDWLPAPRGFSFTLGTGNPDERIVAEFIDQYGW